MSAAHQGTEKNSTHYPVMLPDVLQALAPKDGEIYVDATFGAGGYSRAILESAECRVYAIDRDPQVVMLADALARDFPGRFLLLTGCFGDMLELLAREGIDTVDGIVMDLGVSSMQLDQSERGFSFRFDGPLDMRMGTRGMTAAVLVNTLPEQELADVIYRYGEERMSRRIAKAIVSERDIAPIETTARLAQIVRSVVRRSGDTDPATRTFQALRISVNEELKEIENALASAPHLLRPGGRLIAVTFHSLEDRIVKQFLRPPPRAASRHDMAALLRLKDAVVPPVFNLPHSKPILPSERETKENPRSRSAKMRVAIRTQQPVESGEIPL
jgi:16S rRNA (cytosine1402-N4)-methyltransferase